ncbi:MAG: GntR family transcriptional regulator [Rubrobacter sp.]|nr:GntR family transcriptional regulator [Rubrobacter sp.]
MRCDRVWFGKEAEIGANRDGALKNNLLYVEVEERIEDRLVRGHYKAGERIPPEAEFARDLGVSRATVRAGMGRLVERGVLERRQGSGTFLVRPPGGARLRNGLERLETYTVQAERLDLSLDSRNLRIESAGAGAEEAEALDVFPGSRVVKVSRVLLVEGESAAWMVDIVPEDVVGETTVREHFRPEAMVLDMLVSVGVPVGFSKLLIDAEMIEPDGEVGKSLGLYAPSAALSLIETMHLSDGRPAQWSRNVFLPGHLDLHVIRELFEVRKLS